MFTPQNLLISGGNFTLNSNEAHYHGLRHGSDILQRATATAAFHNSEERFDPPKCHPNTRVAVLNKIMKWIKREEDLDGFIMWLYGPAGAGKSAIAETIAEMCEQEMILLASFFFSRNDPSRSTVKPLIATIVYQITLNLPAVREAILSAIEHDPLIFSKSFAVQVKTLIVAPLQLLAEEGYFNDPSSRRLVIIDGLDECSDPKVQQNILQVLADAQQQHRLPLVFLVASRPEQHISLTFNTRSLSTITSRLALDDSYLPEEDIKLFLADKFQEIKSTHQLRAYIPSEWPLPNVLEQLVQKSSGQFIYASTVIRYVSSIRHKPVDRLDIILGLRPPQRDLPFAELDALYTHILAGVEDIEHALEILSVIFFCENPKHNMIWNNSRWNIEDFLCLQPGDVELYLGDLNSLITIDRWGEIRILHASLTDFFVDPTRSKRFWINYQAQHTAFAHRCLQVLQIPAFVNPEISMFCFYDIVYHLENAEMTPELHDDVINFSFNKLWGHWGAKKSDPAWNYVNMHNFLECLKRLLPSEVHHISQTHEVDFDRILCNALEGYHSLPGFNLLLGGLLQFIMHIKQQHFYPPGMVAYLCLVCWQGEGYIFDDIGFCGIGAPDLQVGFISGTLQFLLYLRQLLENPERAGTHVFDQHRYKTAARECLQLCLCSHRYFSKGTTESGQRDGALRRSKPSAWIARMGVHSRIWKARHHFHVLLRKASTRRFIHQNSFFPDNSPEHEYCRSLSYRWALDLLPLFLEKSAISLELAEVLRRRTFTRMVQQFPRRNRLAKEAIAKYLLRVESEAGNS